MVIDLFELQINTVEFSSSFINFIYILFLAEILKGGLVVFVLNDELNGLIVDETFEEQLKNTSWFFFNNIAENISIMIGILTFIMSFKKLTKATKLLEVILLSITIGIGLFISNMDWT